MAREASGKPKHWKAPPSSPLGASPYKQASWAGGTAHTPRWKRKEYISGGNSAPSIGFEDTYLPSKKSTSKNSCSPYSTASWKGTKQPQGLGSSHSTKGLAPCSHSPAELSGQGRALPAVRGKPGAGQCHRASPAERAHTEAHGCAHIPRRHTRVSQALPRGTDRRMDLLPASGDSPQHHSLRMAPPG